PARRGTHGARTRVRAELQAGTPSAKDTGAAAAAGWDIHPSRGRAVAVAGCRVLRRAVFRCAAPAPRRRRGRGARGRSLQQRAQHPGVLLVGLQALDQQVLGGLVVAVVGHVDGPARAAAHGFVADHQLAHHLAPVGRLGGAGLLADRGELDELGVGAGGVEAQGADALGDLVERVPLLGVLLLEHDVQGVEHRPGHVPVEVVGLEVERVGVGQELRQLGGDLPAVLRGDADVDGLALAGGGGGGGHHAAALGALAVGGLGRGLRGLAGGTLGGLAGGDLGHGEPRGDGFWRQYANVAGDDRRSPASKGLMESRDAGATTALNRARRAIDAACTRDRGRLLGLWSRWKAAPASGPAREAFAAALQASVDARDAAAARLPAASVAPDLPIAAHADRIVELLRRHQVLVVAGETGSGKTTQLPKLCLQAGRGAAGMIGCTQPRRIAARAVARRVAEELQVPLGGAVGFQVRFNDSVGEHTAVKFMTDGILLAEIASDRWLSRYDTIIVDEAHERSLNIDFLLGYLKRLLPRRPDLKLVVTSATIDTERFAGHFGGAPVVEVEGRGYPVEVRYRPLGEGEADEAPPPSGGGRARSRAEAPGLGVLDGIVA